VAQPGRRFCGRWTFIWTAGLGASLQRSSQRSGLLRCARRKPAQRRIAYRPGVADESRHRLELDGKLIDRADRLNKGKDLSTTILANDPVGRESADWFPPLLITDRIRARACFRLRSRWVSTRPGPQKSVLSVPCLRPPPAQATDKKRPGLRKASQP
jgi:hypothetical protein